MDPAAVSGAWLPKSSSYSSRTFEKYFDVSSGEWTKFKTQYLVPFAEKHMTASNWQHTPVVALDVIEQAGFLRLEAIVNEECGFYRNAKKDRRHKKIVLAQALRLIVKIIRDRHVRGAKAEAGSLTARSTSITSGDSILGASSQYHNVVKTEEVEDFVPISSEEPVDVGGLHVRLSRRIGQGRPILSYQTYLWALSATSKSIATNTTLVDTLSYEELEQIATEHLGFDSREEVMFVEYGPRHKPEWLFIQDDASFCSTIKTWHIEHPRTRIVQILISIRPAWIRPPGDGDEDEDDGDEEDEQDDNGEDADR